MQQKQVVFAAEDWQFEQKDTKQNQPEQIRANSAHKSNFGAP